MSTLTLTKGALRFPWDLLSFFAVLVHSGSFSWACAKLTAL